MLRCNESRRARKRGHESDEFMHGDHHERLSSSPYRRNKVGSVYLLKVRYAPLAYP